MESCYKSLPPIIARPGHEVTELFVVSQFDFTQSRKDSQRRNERALFASLRPLGLAALRETKLTLPYYSFNYNGLNFVAPGQAGA